VVQQIILKDNDENNGKYSTRRIIMLSFLKKIFGAKPSESTAAPYKVEGTEHFPFPKTVEEAKPAVKKPAVKKPAVKKPAVKKPRAPKSPKA
jgi:hypothetical protein